jgi:hypothetical protein
MSFAVTPGALALAPGVSVRTHCGQAVRAAEFKVDFFVEFLMKALADVRLGGRDENEGVGSALVQRVADGMIDCLQSNRRHQPKV